MRPKKIETASERMAAQLRSEADKLEQEVKALRKAADTLEKRQDDVLDKRQEAFNTLVKSGDVQVSQF